MSPTPTTWLSSFALSLDRRSHLSHSNDIMRMRLGLCLSPRTGRSSMLINLSSRAFWIASFAVFRHTPARERQWRQVTVRT